VISVSSEKAAAQRLRECAGKRAGSVASAARYLIKGILTDDPNVSQICDTSKNSKQNSKTAVVSGLGVGARIVEKFFVGRKKETTIKEQLVNLKKSGYARIVKEKILDP
jgi:hypothetical protein